MLNSLKNFLGLDIKASKYALSDDPMFGRIADAKKPDKWVFSTCGYCGVGCGLYIGVKDGKAVYTKGNACHSVNMGTLCPKGLSEHEMLTSSNRLLSPLIRKGETLEKASWDEAFTKVSETFKSISEKYGSRAIGVLSTGQLLTEEFYTLGKLVQLGLRTNNYDGNTTLCMASAVAGYKQSLGSDGPTGSYEDFECADVIVLVGANIADNHPILKLHIAKNTKKPKIIVIDPRASKTAQMADIFVPLKPRTDLALFNGLAYIVLEQGWENSEYLKANVTGLGDLRRHLQNYPPQEVANITGVDVKTLYELARLIAGAPAALTAWTMGVNQSYMGTDTVSAIINLHLLTGQIGRPGASPFSITGQCNAMGTRESGFTSSLPGYRNYGDEKAAQEYADIVHVPLELIPTSRGYKYGEIIGAIERGEIKALWVVATNPLVSFVDQTRLRAALAKLDLLVVQDAFMSDTAELADVVFSAATWGEKEGTYTNSERRCNRANKAINPPGEAKSDFDIFLEFSGYFEGVKELIYPNWETPADAFEEWKRVTQGQLCDYSGMSYEMMELRGGIQWPCNEQFPLGTPRLYTPEIGFRTLDGKAKLLSLEWIPLQEPTVEQFPVILNTGRTVEQWHTRTKTREIGILNDLAPEAWVDINPADAEQLEVKSGDRLSISSPRGRVDNIVVRVTQTVREGNVFVPFHFNTQLINTLTPSLFCPKSGEPNFKQTAVQLHSQKVPEGIKMKSPQISGEITLQRTDSDLRIEEKTLEQAVI
ncbi:nitrate reductase [Sulfuricurvum sp. RIFCSPLOWO2_12_FULL_43_24]|uniref:molybdopterin oxidoreductase family protein n=1 Tax=Sulfuricurvum sp. RIFCSPLOWO2_12_FULL_43_24 TaxID=1802247 RepID=UPI0008AFBE48|nr:nitrate reductase [Sulfuricurvum sp. RIFCSPLOWO2_12_FULL_43_24]OHD90810.1 MAG: molybdopterin oxidoreductase [Sulfuricurvum sp. RIFCSPLOWO2_12_FULL_43_24]